MLPLRGRFDGIWLFPRLKPWVYKIIALRAMSQGSEGEGLAVVLIAEEVDLSDFAEA